MLGVDTGAVADARSRVASLAAGLTGSAGTPDSAPEALRWDGDQVGAGYGALTGPVRDALSLLARTEGVVLDPVYTGRAAAELVAGVRSGTIRPGERTVLLHSGGLPGLFGHAEAASLAR